MAAVFNTEPYADIGLTTSGDFDLDTLPDGTSDLKIRYTEEFMVQELELIFRNQINIKDYIGEKVTTESGSIIADILKDEIRNQIELNETLPDERFEVDIYPLPDNYLVVEINDTAMADGDAIVTQRLNFDNGSIEGVEPSSVAIEAIYDTSLDPVDYGEFIYLYEGGNVIEPTHYLAGIDDFKVYGSETALSNKTETRTETLSNATDLSTDTFSLISIFGDDLRSLEFEVLSVQNENGDDIEYTILSDGYNIRITSLFEEYTDLVIIIEVSLHIAYGTDSNYVEESQVINEIELIFPHERLLGQTYVYLDKYLDPGEYYITYQRYPLRTGN